MILRFLNSMQNGTIVALERLWKIKYIVISRAKHFHLSKKSREAVALERADAGLARRSVVESPPAQAGDMDLTPGPEGPTRHGAAESTCRNYGVHVPRAHAAQQEKPQQWKPVHHSCRVDPTRFNQRKLTQQQRASADKKRTMNKMEFYKIFSTKKDKKRTEGQRTERQTKRQMAKNKIQYW